MPAMTNSGRTALSPPDFWPDHCWVADGAKHQHNPLITHNDLSGELVHTQLCALPAYGRAVKACGTRRLFSGPGEHEATGRWLQAGRDLEYEAASLAMQCVTQGPIWRA